MKTPIHTKISKLQLDFSLLSTRAVVLHIINTIIMYASSATAAVRRALIPRSNGAVRSASAKAASKGRADLLAGAG